MCVIYIMAYHKRKTMKRPKEEEGKKRSKERKKVKEREESRVVEF